MKIRNGFVSNSSSSSFLIVMKNNQKLNKESLIDAFDISEKSPLFGFAKDLAQFLVRESEESTIKSMHDNYIGSYGKGEMTEDEMIDELVEDMSMSKEMLESLKEGKIKVYEGQACNDGDDPIASYLYDSDGVYFDTDKISMKNSH